MHRRYLRRVQVANACNRGQLPTLVEPVQALGWLHIFERGIEHHLGHGAFHRAQPSRRSGRSGYSRAFPYIGDGLAVVSIASLVFVCSKESECRVAFRPNGHCWERGRNLVLALRDGNVGKVCHGGVHRPVLIQAERGGRGTGNGQCRGLELKRYIIILIYRHLEAWACPGGAALQHQILATLALDGIRHGSRHIDKALGRNTLEHV